jgi:hypothetical protein
MDDQDHGGVSGGRCTPRPGAPPFGCTARLGGEVHAGRGRIWWQAPHVLTPVADRSLVGSGPWRVALTLSAEPAFMWADHLAALIAVLQVGRCGWLRHAADRAPCGAHEQWQAGVSDRLWSLEDVVAKMDELAPKPRGPYKKCTV